MGNNQSTNRPRVYIVAPSPITANGDRSDSVLLANRIAEVWQMGGHPVLTFVSQGLGLDRATVCIAEMRTCDIAYFWPLADLFSDYTPIEKALAVEAIKDRSIFATDNPTELAEKIAELSAEPGAGGGPFPCPMDIPPLACFDMALGGLSWTAIIGEIGGQGHAV